MEMNIEDAKWHYLEECRKLGKNPYPVTAMTYCPYSEKYTLSNERDGEFVDLHPNGTVASMHWKS